jgi:4-hydroxy-tetrahydrodipicolinate reductase
MMPLTRVTIAGAAGRMGQALVRCCEQLEAVTLVGAVEAPGHAALGRDAGEFAAGRNVGVPLTDDLEAALQNADVLIDFTFHEAVPRNAQVASRRGCAIVIGTTALTDEEAASVSEAANRVPIVWAPNMSLGVNLVFAMVKQAARVLGPGYAVAIEDVHHIHKLDAPSGTALRLGEKAAEGAGMRFSDVYVHDEEGRAGIEDPTKIVIRSYRRDEVVGDHTVKFTSSAETITLTHQAKSRDCLALGALHAASWVVTRRPRLYDMQDVLGLT